MMMRYSKLLALFFFIGFSSAETITDQTMGYSINLPDTWVRTKKSPVQDIFEYTSETYLSELSVVRHDFSDAQTYSTAEEWIQANFIAYKLVIESDPLYVLAFYDTVTAVQNGSIRSADVYSSFFDLDSLVGDYAVYIRFTAVENHGYELYALGPIDDMELNVSTYAQLLGSIELLDSLGSVPIRVTPSVFRKVVSPQSLFTADLLGRVLRREQRISPVLLLLSGGRKKVLPLKPQYR